ncbi:protein MCM10 homolog [Genypterus blacodes]|uniref:protein MCM10 homolog n=1 Tax=Genypterus blacodes TaxID=154954 RepID=UPI003F7620AE
MEDDGDLDILVALLAESGDIEEEQNGQEQADDLDDLFDNDDDEGEEYKESAEEEGREAEVEEAADNTEGEEGGAEGKQREGESSESLNKSKDDLQEELMRMQEQMQRLQQQLEATQKVSSSAPVSSGKSPTGPKPTTPRQPPSRKTQVKPASISQKTKAVASTPTPVRKESTKLQESSDFSAQLSNVDFKRKPRVAHHAKANTSPEDRGPLVEIKVGGTFQPVESGSEVANRLRSPPSSQWRQAAAGQSKSRPAPALPPTPKDVGVERYSRLRLRKPLVSSSDMDSKMADRKLIPLSQLPERLAREKLEDSDWVTFAVLVHKVTQQSNNSGKTFSIWKLNDLHNLEVFVSLLLFGEVHKELWKTDPGTVVGLLNPNPMKQKDGYDGVSLTVDHSQKILVLGVAQDFGNCQGMKKNGDPCSQIVNMYECQFCQYHVKAQYKKMCSKRAELQSSFSGKAPNKVKGKGNSLRERLCQDGFYYGGVSSAACTGALAPSKPNKPGQRTLDNLFVRGSAQHVDQAKRLAMQSGKVSGCSDEFKSLMSVPTPGALQLKRHLAHGSQSVCEGAAGATVQSISATDLLKQQKQKQREFMQNRQRRVVKGSGGARPGPSSLPGRGGLTSPKAASVVPKSTQSPAAPHTPTLGRGFSEGEDIVFFEHSPPSVPSGPGLSSAKMAALRKLRAKGAGLIKEDPNAVKRKRNNSSEINARVEKNLTSPNGEQDGGEEEEPAQKRKREQLEYMQSEEFQKILNAKSRHGAALQSAEYQLQERYFDVLVKKEQMEEKMNDIREMKCRAVTCRKCCYTYFKPADRCVTEKHDMRWHEAKKRFFKCPCGQRSIALDRLPHKHCSNCGLFKWERVGMLKEKTGPKIGGELLLTRGEEHGRFLNSMQ